MLKVFVEMGNVESNNFLYSSRYFAGTRDTIRFFWGQFNRYRVLLVIWFKAKVFL